MLRHSRVPTLLILAVALVPGLCRAERQTYQHDGEALFSIDFPDDWYVDADFVSDAKAAGTLKGGKPGLRILEAMPSDGSKLWFGIWVAPDSVRDFDKALEYIASLDGDLFTNVESSQPKDTSFGGMPAKTMYGIARRLGEEVEFAVALFQPREAVITVALYVGRPQTWGKHQAQLQKVVDSIQSESP